MENVNPNITNLRWDRCKKKRDRKKREKTKDIYVSDAVRKEQNDRKKNKVKKKMEKCKFIYIKKTFLEISTILLIIKN